MVGALGNVVIYIMELAIEVPNVFVAVTVIGYVVFDANPERENETVG